MKLITRDTDYAMRALMFIARKNKKRVTVTQLVRELKIPQPFLRKILQALNREGILLSFKGSGGGFVLGRAAEKIFLLDLMRVFQGPLCLNECFFKKRICPNVNSCLLRRRISRIQKHVFRELQNITLASLLR